MNLHKINNNNNQCNDVTNKFSSEITLKNLLSGINLRIRIGKKVYLFNQEAITNTIEHNLSPVSYTHL
ncbi:hypothetical protein, partial [Bacillus timonensis]|uniref:hypothetical protein n=1 Tax=Bacillus timonensis TaxID=1033734 RepID=UPI001A94315B